MEILRVSIVLKGQNNGKYGGVEIVDKVENYVDKWLISGRCYAGYAMWLSMGDLDGWLAGERGGSGVGEEKMWEELCLKLRI